MRSTTRYHIATALLALVGLTACSGENPTAPAAAPSHVFAHHWQLRSPTCLYDSRTTFLYAVDLGRGPVSTDETAEALTWLNTQVSVSNGDGLPIYFPAGC